MRKAICLISVFTIILIIGGCFFWKFNVNIFYSYFGALFGAISAFFLNHIYEIYRQEQSNHASLTETSYRLGLMQKSLLELHKEINKDRSKLSDSIENYPKRNDLEWQWIKRHIAVKIPSIRYEILSFLLSMKAGHQKMNDLVVAGAQYEQVIDILEDRNKLYSIYLEKTENSSENQLANFEYLNKILGEKLFYEITERTKILLTKLDDAIYDINKAKVKTDEILNATYILCNKS
jgi:hypothetical protein